MLKEQFNSDSFGVRKAGEAFVVCSCTNEYKSRYFIQKVNVVFNTAQFLCKFIIAIAAVLKSLIL